MSIRIRGWSASAPDRAPASETEGSTRIRAMLPFYSYALPLMPFLMVYGGNHHRLPLAAFLNAAAMAVIAYLALNLALRFLVGQKRTADLVLACVFIGATMAPYFLGSNHWIWMACWSAVAGIVCLFEPLRAPFGRFLSAATLVTAITTAAVAISWPVLWERSSLSRTFEGQFPKLPAATATGAVKRDIYYIVLDRYARADQLKDVYGFDNSAFMEALRAHGFSIADDAYSNYQRTAHSLVSSLNMDYLPGEPHSDEKAKSDWVPLYDRIRHSRLADVLTRSGYAFHFFGSWWEPTRRNHHADSEINYRAWPELARIVFENSFGSKLAPWFRVSDLDARQLQCRRAKLKFAALSEAATRRDPGKPRFVFAHFLVPHPPFVIDAEGNCLSAGTVAGRSREENYVQQVRYANQQVLAFLDRVKEAGGPRPIIVLQADEGPWPKQYARDEIHRLGVDVSHVEWLDATNSELREKMAILNAVHLPGLDNVELSSDATPVNTFRLILREYFEADLPALPDRSHVFPSRRNIYQFHDVTSKLRQR